MNEFKFRKGKLYCEDVSIEAIAKKEGTPFYLYSKKTFLRHFDAFDGAFKSVRHITCFAVKANSNIAILNLLAKAGAGADIVSGGELFRAKKAGFPSKKIIFSGVGKSDEEIEYALRAGILMFNIESSEEAETINKIAAKIGKKAPVSFRINPDIDPKTHPYISTGLSKNKFGISIDDALKEYKRANKMKWLDVVGIHYHIGSQLTSISPFVDSIKRMKRLLQILRSEGINIKYFDMGGGLGITYKDETPPHPREYAKALIPHIKDLDCTVLFEPGRVIAGNAGILVTKVLFTKKTAVKNFVIVDAGMNDLLRPSLYGAYQEIVPVKKSSKKKIEVDVVGPICETGDFLARDRLVAKVKRDDLLAVMSAGAYGFTMSSVYNSRPRVPEILADGKNYYVIRKRETYKDLIRGEIIPKAQGRKS
ncbi:MAG: diaminopimelate decarboxylase [Candidatus Schekmanbacteria bacterium]|nr:MAG: diaminopimelate decarboxylase [Candidatus Schekmanbacteria bacterium]